MWTNFLSRPQFSTMTSRNRVLLAVLFYSAIFDNLDQGKAAVIVIEESTTDITTAVANVTIRYPDLSVWPLPNHEKIGNASNYPIISYNAINESSSYRPLVRSLQSLLNDYKVFDSVPGRREKVVVCSFDMPPPIGKVCDIDVKHWYPCDDVNEFAYLTKSPCIFLKLDTPPGWKPEFYNDSNLLPDEMPSDLKSHIALMNPVRSNTVWVSCGGENSTDEENVGPIQYFPYRGIPGYQFLNNDVEGYLSPLIAVRFERPKVGTLINIKCKAWARNINHNGTALKSAMFGLLIE